MPRASIVQLIEQLLGTFSIHLSRFIGIFDSGVGGLAIYRAVRELLPAEDIVYVADSGFAPYGGREPEYITRRVMAITDALVDAGARAVVVACNTATVTTVSAVRARHSLPIVGIEPAIKPAATLTRSGRVVVLATQRTAESASVADLCARYAGDAEIVIQPCPGLADQVEKGDIESDETAAMLRRYLAPVTERQADTLVLGCTHFTFLEPQIRRLVGAEVSIVEPSAAVARQLVRRLADVTGGTPVPGSAADTFYTTAASAPAVAEVMSRLLGRTVAVTGADTLGLASGNP